MTRYDILIKGGLIADGLGGEPIEADVAVADGRIAAVGKISGSGIEEVDARGLLVTPGFVDIHTHLDGYVTWSTQLDPLPKHGITTAMFGNCGVGFAPCRSEDRGRLVTLMEGVEDIPEPVLTEGLPWNWTSFPDYLDAIESRQYDIDICAQLPHAPLRVFVMGQRAANHEPATADDIAQMGGLTKDAMLAGAFGFSTSRSLAHRGSDGANTPSLDATEAELTAIGEGMKAAGRGVIQLISDFDDIDAEFGIFRRVAEKSGRPMSMSVVQQPYAPDRWRQILDRIAEANRDGLVMRAQVCGRPVGMLAGFEITFCPFSFCPTYQQISQLPFQEKLAALRRPDLRARIIEEFAVPFEQRGGVIAGLRAAIDMRSIARKLTDLNNIFPLGDPINYEPSPEMSVAQLAEKEDRSAADYVYDLLLGHDGRALLYIPVTNYVDHTLDVAKAMLTDKNTVLGLSDAGAHSSFVCDVSFTTFMLTNWARDRKPGLPLGFVVQSLTSRTAQTVGLMDRGVLATGYRADINIIDLAKLRLHTPKVIYDLPGGGKRLTQETEGYVLSIVKGVPTYRDGKHTGALPGRLVRAGRQQAVGP